MNPTAASRFPPVSGLLGWIGAALLAVGILMEALSLLLFVGLASSKNRDLVVPVIASFLLSLCLIAAALVTWRVGLKRAGLTRPSSLSDEQRRQVIAVVVTMSLGDLLGGGGFVYLALALAGTAAHRFTLAITPLMLSSLTTYFGLRRLRVIQGRQPYRFLGLSPPKDAVVFATLALAYAGLLLVTGLFIIPY